MIAAALSLAAAPTFAVMALLTGWLGGDPALMLCGSPQGSPLTGMVFMYGLMSLFHLGPWARAASRWFSHSRINISPRKDMW